jgi:hypothetical protein
MKTNNIKGSGKGKPIDYKELKALDNYMEKVNEEYHSELQKTLQEANHVIVD